MLPFFPYQDEGADMLAQRHRFGLHDEMGLGKSAQLIRAADIIGARRGIVTCPAKLRRNWMNEFRKWSRTFNDARTLCVANDAHGINRFMKARHEMVLMLSYELATRYWHKIWKEGEPIDFVGFDEAHYLKNSESQRTKACLGNKLDGHNSLISFADYVWHLSGTPMINDPHDIYTFLRMCGATSLTERTFMKRYFFSDVNAYGSRQTIRPEMLPELTYIIDHNRLRRTKKGVGLQLPPIFMQQALVDGDDSAIVALLASYPGLEEAIYIAVSEGGLSFLDAAHIMTLRRLLGEAKAVPYGYMLADEIKISGEKHIVFGHHVIALHRVRQILQHHNINTVLVDGSVTDRQAQASVDEFQNNPNCMVFIGNMHAAGIGQTLTAAWNVDIFESDWAPGMNAQGIMRAHRIGQHHNVFVRFITLANSFDIHVNNIVAEKVKAIADIEGEPMNAMAMAA